MAFHYHDHKNLLTGDIYANMLKINEILEEHVTYGLPAVNYMQKIHDSHTATVFSTTTGAEAHMPERRSGSKVTFGQDVTNMLSEQIIEELYYQLQHHVVQIRPATHGDIIHYRPGDFFKWHVDHVPDYKLPKINRRGETELADGSTLIVPCSLQRAKWRYYTMLVGLENTIEGGATAIRSEYDGGVHHFDGGNRCGQYILFPSDVMHCGEKVIAGSKTAIKIDFWIQSMPFDSYVYCREEMIENNQYYEPDEDDYGWCNED